jgi:hypothetical protein
LVVLPDAMSFEALRARLAELFADHRSALVCRWRSGVRIW